MGALTTITRSEVTADTRCKFMRAIDALRADPLYDEEDAVIVRDWLAWRVAAAEIGRTLRGLGYDVGTTTIKQHRLNDCGCSAAS